VVTFTITLHNTVPFHYSSFKVSKVSLFIMARRPRQQTATIQAFTSVAKPLVDTVHASKKRKQPTEVNDDFPVDLKKRRFAVVVTPETPSKACNHAFSKLSIDLTTSSSSGAKRKGDLNFKSDSGVSLSSSAPSTAVDSPQSQLEIQSLEKLFTAFLSALTLHYAHSGISSSVDVRTLIPSITKIWGIRKVVLLDIRQVLGILNHQNSGRRLSPNIFSLKDFGGGKVCLETKQTINKRKASGYLLDEVQLKRAFKESLDKIWASYCSDSHLEIPDTSTTFFDQLPLEALVASSSTRKIAALHATGQRRLEEVLTPFKKIKLNDDVVDRPLKRSKTESDATLNRNQQAQSPGVENVPPQTAADRSHLLLERIKAKEALAATLPAGPKKEERERIAALQRSQELLTILNLLAVSKGGSRVSFPLPTLITNIQSSIRNPMSKDQILRCVKLLQTEVAPGHISLVTFGSITGVVVDISKKLSAGEVTERLRAKGVTV
jgi:DNA replication factor Cdt1-like protein